MAQMSEIARGLQILLAHGDSLVACEHDIIYAADEPRPDRMTDAERREMEAARWHWGETDGGEGWYHFT